MTFTLVRDGDSTPQPRISVRPGAAVLRVSPDKLQLVFGTHTATFKGIALVRCISAILNALRRVSSVDEVSQAVSGEGFEEEFVAYSLQLLESNLCLLKTRVDEVRGDHGEASVDVRRYYDSLGLDASSSLESLRDALAICLVDSRSAEQLRSRLEACGIQHALVVPQEDETTRTTLERIDAIRSHEGRRSIVCCWGFSSRWPLPRLLNRLAIAARVPSLFGVAEGLVSRIGPLVFPGSSPCLECLVGRLSSHAGPDDYLPLDEYTRLLDDHTPPAHPSHPAFLGLAISAFAMELSRFLEGQSPQCVGGFLETHHVSGTTVRRTLLRAPRCPACRPPSPHRLAWDLVAPRLAVLDSER